MQHIGTSTINRLHTEGAAMNHIGPGSINYLVAAARHADLQAEAERDRQFAQARAARGIAISFGDAVRRAIGVRVVRAGERLAQGTGHAAPAAGLTPKVAVAGR